MALRFFRLRPVAPRLEASAALPRLLAYKNVESKKRRLLTAVDWLGLRMEPTLFLLSSRQVNGFDIYVMNADGSHVVQLTGNDAEDVEPVWSP
ncbi:MAG TPA: hypothetical protein EYG11_22170 [Candidatus Latescibacteria bacterium]|nr:hypothetical protein [Candidatus Latescibacterota bacterium]